MSAIARTALAVALGSVAATGQRLLYETQGTASRSVWRAAAAGDLTADGVPDFVTAGVGGVELFCGKTGRWVRTVALALGTTGLSGGRDADGDAVCDVAFGSYLAVEVRSGKNGALILRIPSPHPLQRFGEWVALVEDLDNDKRADIVVGAPGKWSFDANKALPGFVASYSSRTGKQLRKWTFGHAVDLNSFAADGDTDNDGRTDVQVGWTLHFRKLIFDYSRAGADSWNPATGWLRTFRRGQEVQGNKARFSVASAGDVDGDGYDDVLAGDLNKRDVVVQSGKNGSALWSHWLVSGRVYGPAGDVDADGRTDYALEQLGTRVGIYSGRWLRELAHLAGDAAERFGDDALSIGDVTRDGVPELLVTAPRAAQGSGVVRVYTFRPFEWRPGFATLFEPTGRPTMAGALLVGTTPPTTGGKLAAELRATGYDFAVVLMGLVPHAGEVAPIPSQPLLLYLDRRFLLPFFPVVNLISGRGQLAITLPALQELVGVDLALQSAVFALSGPGAVGATNLLLAKIGHGVASRATLFATPFPFKAAAADNYRNLLKKPARIFHNHGDAVFLTFGGSKTPGVGPIEVRTAPGKPPSGGGLLLGTIPAAGSVFGTRVWVPSGKSKPVGVYLLNRDAARPVTMQLLGLRVE